MVSLVLVLFAVVVMRSSPQSRPKPRQGEPALSDHRVRPASEQFAELISRGWPARNQEQKTYEQKVLEAYQNMASIMDELEFEELPDWLMQTEHNPYPLREEYMQLLKAKRTYDWEVAGRIGLEVLNVGVNLEVDPVVGSDGFTIDLNNFHGEVDLIETTK